MKLILLSADPNISSADSQNSVFQSKFYYHCR